MADNFRQFFDDRFSVIMCKIDLTTGLSLEHRVSSVKKWVESVGGNICASTVGEHYLGKNRNPHAHFHMIVDNYLPSQAGKNPSRDRKNWAKKNEQECLDDCEFRHQLIKKDMPPWQILSYPFKEGNVVSATWFGDVMPEALKEFLLETGKKIFDVKKALEERQESLEDRKKKALMEMYEICEKGYKDNLFWDFKSMLLYLDMTLAQIPLEEKPCLQNYENNVLKIAEHLEIKEARYSNFIIRKYKL